MRMITEPESWLGLRSERAIAGDFAAPVARRVTPHRPRSSDAPPVSLRAVGSVIRRTLGMLLGR